MPVCALGCVGKHVRMPLAVVHGRFGLVAAQATAAVHRKGGHCPSDLGFLHAAVAAACACQHQARVFIYLVVHAVTVPLCIQHAPAITRRMCDCVCTYVCVYACSHCSTACDPKHVAVLAGLCCAVAALRIIRCTVQQLCQPIVLHSSPGASLAK
jgi:hypothetical protein